MIPEMNLEGRSSESADDRGQSPAEASPSADNLPSPKAAEQTFASLGLGGHRRLFRLDVGDLGDVEQ